MGKKDNEEQNSKIRVDIAKELKYQIIPLMDKERQNIAEVLREQGRDKEAEEAEG
jgi:hypothetical protein